MTESIERSWSPARDVTAGTAVMRPDIAPDEHNCNTARGETPDGADDHQLLVVRARAFGNAPTGAVCAGIMRLGLLPKDLGLSAIRSERLR